MPESEVYMVKAGKMPESEVYMVKGGKVGQKTAVKFRPIKYLVLWEVGNERTQL